MSADRVVLTGSDLTLEEVELVARRESGVAIDRRARARMRAARRVVERVLARGEPVYGLTTGVGEKKRSRVSKRDLVEFNRRLLVGHRLGQGPLAPRDVVRAALVRMANGFARGTTMASPELADLLVAALDARTTPPVHLLGSVGVGDLAPNAELAHGVLGDYELAPGEGLALVANNAFSTGWAALAVSDGARLLGALEAAAALELEAFGANLSILHPAVAEARPMPGHRAAARRLRALLAGSGLWERGAARNLQDPLTFRGMPQSFGAAREALGFVASQVAAELNAASDNPLVVPREKRILSVWNGEIAGLVTALDLLRISLATVLTSACERALKLLQAPMTGLSAGLAPPSRIVVDGLAELGVVAQSIAAEARLLAQPVSFELASTTQAEGIEDRTTMAPLAARRLSEMVGLGARLCAIELAIAAQAIDLRKPARLGRGTRRALAKIRGLFPFVTADHAEPMDLEPLVLLVRDGALSPAVGA